MLVVYKLLIDTGLTELSPMPSIGFKDGIYHLSTAPLTSYYDCLDGSSFSDISQENMIVKGGELSLVGDVKIKIVSQEILSHLLKNDIALLGSQISLSVDFNNKHIVVFEKMSIASFAQTDELSIEVNAKDSTFANAKQISLSLPREFAGTDQLETSYGKDCLLRLYKQNSPAKSISQGIGSESPGWPGTSPGDMFGPKAQPTPELEQDQRNTGDLADIPVVDVLTTTSDGKPAFAKNFVAYTVENPDSRQPARLCIQRMGGWGIALIVGEIFNIRRAPEISSALIGKTIEICSGAGRGNYYRITKIDTIDLLGDLFIEPFDVLVLDRPVKAGEILGTFDVAYRKSLPRLPARSDKFEYLPNGAKDASSGDPAISIAFKKDSETEVETEDISTFRFADTMCRYAIPTMKNIAIKPPINSRIVEKMPDFTIVEFEAFGDKSILTKESKHQPRWRFKNNGVAYWTYRTPPDNVEVKGEIHIKGDTPVKQDVVIDNRSWQAVASFKDTSGRYNNAIGLQMSFYSRIDDMPAGEKCTIRPRFSFRVESIPNWDFSARATLVDDAGNVIAARNIKRDGCFAYGWEISLTRNEAKVKSAAIDKAEALLEDLRETLVFEGNPAAKYIFIQLYFESGPNYIITKSEFYLAALPVLYETDFDVESYRIEGHDSRSLSSNPPHSIANTGNIIKRARQLCLDYSIGVDTQSFDGADDDLHNAVGNNYASAFIPFKHGEIFADKFAEICRATNVSMFSNGSKLYARHVLTNKSIWNIAPTDVIKDSVEVRAVGINSMATEWNFAASTWDGQKTLTLDTNVDSLDTEWSTTGEAIHAELIYPEYVKRGIQGFGARIAFNPRNIADKIHIGDMYKVAIREGAPAEICELVDIRLRRMNSTGPYIGGADVLFYAPGFPKSGAAVNMAPNFEIYLLSQERNWQNIVSGNISIGLSDVDTLLQISKSAFAKIKQRMRLDERYTKHQVVAFGEDKLWMESFIATTKHNAYAKTIVSFKVPINRLPLDANSHLCDLLLKNVVLNFGGFRAIPFTGWIISYSLAPAEDAVRIEVMNSEPVRELLYLDENKLEEQLVVDERENSEDRYNENLSGAAMQPAPQPPVVENAILTENGYIMLTESGEIILMEEA